MDHEGLFLQGVRVSDLLDQGNQEVESGQEGGVVSAELLNDVGVLLRDRDDDFAEY